MWGFIYTILSNLIPVDFFYFFQSPECKYISSTTLFKSLTMLDLYHYHSLPTVLLISCFLPLQTIFSFLLGGLLIMNSHLQSGPKTFSCIDFTLLYVSSLYFIIHSQSHYLPTSFHSILTHLNICICYFFYLEFFTVISLICPLSS